jgi:hypothetical protein
MFLGDALLGAFDDLDGDGYPEFAVGGSVADTNVGVDSGTLKCLRLFPAHHSTYCTGKPNSLGCTPGIHSPSGYASVSAAVPFSITGDGFLNQKNGLLFYGYDSLEVPFQGGTLCVKAPTVRTPVQNSGGGATPSCKWARDPMSASQTSLSNAMRMLINP